LYPVNVAAYAGAADVMRVGYEFIKTKRNDANIEEFMNRRDAEGNLVLHAAVDSGSLEAVKLCVENFTHIDGQQEDESTPVHFAALRGELEMIKVMFTAQPKRKKSALCLTDKNGMTALHKAVMFDHVHVAAYLLDEGAEIEAVDKNDHTPLLIAASKVAKKCAMLLVERGANVCHKDKDGRNFIHLAVLSGVKPECLASEKILAEVS
jgi:transient receptor potential cation channel subfamily A member 1